MGMLKNRLILTAMMLALPLAGLVFFGLLTEHNFNTLPYYTVDGPMEGQTLDAQRVGEFDLVNHLGEPFSSDELRGKVWLAAFYGTDAPHVAQVTRQLLWPNFRYRDEGDIVVVSFSLSPEHDTPEVLQEYVERNTRYEDAIRDAVEDIALLKKERDVAKYAREKLTETLKVHSELPVLGPEGHTIPAFAFTGIDSVEISHRTVEGQVKIVDYFFTHCPTICPIMSSQLARTQAWLKGHDLDDEVMLMSHSVDPIRDTPERLKTYATRLGADTTIWKFLTGDKEDLYDQARFGYYLTALESDTAAGGFFHSDTFVLVDQENRIRGLYDGTSTAEVDAMMLDAASLVVTDRH